MSREPGFEPEVVVLELFEPSPLIPGAKIFPSSMRQLEEAEVDP